MSEVIQARVVPFGDTLANWTALNPTPMKGEPVIEYGSIPGDYKWKIGDGTTPYLSLPYQNAGPAGSQTLQDVVDLGYQLTTLYGHTGVMELTDSTITSQITPSAYIGFPSASPSAPGWLIGFSSGTGKFRVALGDSSSVYYSEIIPSTLTANRTLNQPDKSGVIATNDGGTSVQTVTSVTTITIAHGLSWTPSRIFIAPANAVTADLILPLNAVVTTITSTNITVRFSSAVTGTLSINWQAF